MSHTLGLFILTFIFVSITPGMCMILALTMGMTVGPVQTLWMMLGELIGVGMIVTISAIGGGSLMLHYPENFVLLKYLGGTYLLILGVQMWLSKGRLTMPENNASTTLVQSEYHLALQGFITAIVNPKGWAFFMVILPPFLDKERELFPQLSILLITILLIEFISLNIYSFGGKFIKDFIFREGNAKILNRISGTLMMFVAIWLVIG